MEAYEKLEQELAQWTGCHHVVACASGTAALHLAFEALRVRGSIAMPEFTMVACPRAAVLASCRPVFVDCDSLDLLMDLDLTKRACTRDVGAVLAVHVYGRAVNMEELHQRLAYRELYIVEDMAEAHGLSPHPASDAACWSFYKNKTVYGEEGGAVAFRSKETADRARCLRSLGFTEAHDFTHEPRGHNYRMSNTHAQLVRSTLACFSATDRWRRLMVAEYDEQCPKEWRMPARQAPWVYDFRIPRMRAHIQGTLVKTLNGQGIKARHAFKPMSLLPEFHVGGDVPAEAYAASQEVVYVPLYSEQQAKTTFAVAKALCP